MPKWTLCERGHLALSQLKNLDNCLKAVSHILAKVHLISRMSHSVLHTHTYVRCQLIIRTYTFKSLDSNKNRIFIAQSSN